MEMEEDNRWSLQWSFSPVDYLENQVLQDLSLGRLEASNGSIRLTILHGQSVFDEELRLRLHRELDALFQAISILTHRPYWLRQLKACKASEDGQDEGFIFSEELTVAVSISAGRFFTEERQEKERDFLRRIQMHNSDPLLKSLIESYRKAVDDPPNELIHLYEICDAIDKHLGGKKQALKKLDPFTKKQWPRLGELACDLPLNQGRHRGRGFEGLRDATPEELAEARGIALSLIECYLQSLDSP